MRAADVHVPREQSGAAQASAALDDLLHLQGLPLRQLSRADGLRLRRALALIREHPAPPPHLQLPEAAWDLLEPDPGIELLFARRIAAQVRAAVPIARVVTAAASPARRMKTRAGQWLLRSRYHAWYVRMLRTLPNGMSPGFRDYEQWQARECALSLPNPEAAGERPVFSILLAAHNTRLAWLEAAVESMRGQSYGKWELCICDDNSADTRIHRFVDSLPSTDARIRVQRSAVQLGEAGAFNRCAGMAAGDFVACLDHDDLLHPAALANVAMALEQQPDADVIYTDEDYIDEAGTRIRPHFKPDWSPRLLDACMYLGHLVVVRRALFEEIGGFRSEFDGAQDYDLALRATERARQVLHVPVVAYHWRMHPNSVAAGGQNKPRTHTVGHRVLESAVARRRWSNCTVASAAVPGLYFVDRGPLASRPTVDLIVIGQGDADADYEPRRTIRVASREDVHEAARSATGEVLVFLHGRLQPRDPSWLARLVARVSEQEVAVAGCKIVDAEGAIVHAGAAVGLCEGIGNPGRGAVGSPYWLWLDVTREVSAVAFDGLTIRRTRFEAVGGFDSQIAPAYQAADLCLRATQHGGAVILETKAVLCEPRAGAGRERLASADAWTAFVRKWRDRLSRPDPFWSPNLRPDREEILL